MLPEHMAVYKSRPEFIDDLLFLRREGVWFIFL
jgi:hypothetical protein